MSTNGIAAITEQSNHRLDASMLAEWSSKINGKHILVPGGAGYIGTHTVVELLNAGCIVTVVDNLCNSNDEALRRVQQITNKTLTFINVDLNNADELEQRVFVNNKQVPYDAVIHFAALKAVGESVLQPLRYHANNVAGTINLLQCCDKYNIRNIVFSSSATVYGAATKMPITEDFPLGSTNPYGQTKYIIELILKDLAASPSNKDLSKPWRTVLLRYFNPIGAHPSGMIGEDPLGIPNNLVPYVAQVAAKWPDRPYVTVYGNDYPTRDGSGIRDYIHVVDLARGHIAALAEAIYTPGIMKQPCEAYNLGTGHGYSVFEVIAAYSRACGHEVPYKVGPRRPGDTAECYADPSKAAKDLKWKATHTLQEAIDSSWTWQSRNPTGFRTKQNGAAT